MNAEIVPFGKYKGQPAEALLADQDYCQWLTSQPWFRDRWPNVYSVVINYGAEPQDSPEHNQMQARFLDEDWCRSLAAVLCEEGLGHDSQAVTGLRFEASGWDVIFSARVRGEVGTNPHDVNGRQEWDWAPSDMTAYFAVELKPDLGDDYPAVLRQVTGYPHERGNKRCVIARRYAFEHVTWDQVRQIFAASGIWLLAESEITGGAA